MLITINPRIPARLHRDIRWAVALGFWRTNRSGVSVDVTGRSDYGFTGWALCSVREVLLRIPFHPDSHPDAAFPWTTRVYYKRSVPARVNSWQEMLVWLAAHEASHIRQYDRPRYTAGKWPRRPRQSEVLADRWANRVLERQRARL